MRDWSPERAKAFAIEARRDALLARYNTESLLNRVRRIEKIERSQFRLEVLVAACFVALIALLVLQIFGWTTLSGFMMPPEVAAPN